MFVLDSFFYALCFFTSGFLCLVGFMSLYLNFFFKTKIYVYYLSYILSIIIFIATVFLKNTIVFPKGSTDKLILQLLVDVLQIIGHFFFAGFVYYILKQEGIIYRTIKISFQFYTIFTGLYVLSVLIFPEFVNRSIPYFIFSRLVIIILSFIFYYYIAKEIKKVYFRYLFAALNFLLIFGFLAFWDSTFNVEKSIYTGFQYLCIGYVLENACFVGGFIYIYFKVNKQKLEAEFKHQQQLSRVEIEMQFQTMQHIGREIHDNIGQKLTLASLYAQQLAYDNKAPLVTAKIDNISSIINNSLEELRLLSKTLTDNNIEVSNLSDLLKIEVQKFKQLKKSNIHFESDLVDTNLDYQTKSILLRITQEFIQNSFKHAFSKNIEIALSKKLNGIELFLKDDGIGFDVKSESDSGIGLMNIKKRIEIIEASYSFISNSSGTILTIFKKTT